MLRNFLMFAPALAFALPFIAAPPSMARPLAAQPELAEWGDHDDDDDDDDNGGDDLIELHVCFEAQIAIDPDDHRDYQCKVETGPSCFSNCTAEAVAPSCETEFGLSARSGACIEERIDTCRAQCDQGGAGFCSPLKSRHGDNDDDDDDDDHDNDDDVLFINIEQCIDLELDLNDL